jgi:hypothetical protein
MPQLDTVNKFQKSGSDITGVKVVQEQVSGFDYIKQSTDVAFQNKDFGGPGGFDNVVNGRYSGIGRGGSVGDELVRNCSCFWNNELRVHVLCDFMSS